MARSKSIVRRKAAKRAGTPVRNVARMSAPSQQRVVPDTNVAENHHLNAAVREMLLN